MRRTPLLIAVLVSSLLVAGCATSGDQADGVEATTEADRDGGNATRRDGPDDSEAAAEVDGEAEGDGADDEGGEHHTSTDPVEVEDEGDPGPDPNHPDHQGPMQLRCGDLPTYGPFAVPSADVHYTFGSAAVTVTEADGSSTCIQMQLDEGVENVYQPVMDLPRGDATGPGLRLRWATEGSAFEHASTHVELTEGPFAMFSRFERSSDAWVDSMHDICEVRLTHMDERSVFGGFTCDSLPAALNSTATSPITVEGVWYAAR